MNLRSVDLNLLTVFDAVMTEGNITRAAEKIGMSQPAMSIAINRFRHIAKDKLFERTGRGVRPTQRALQLSGPVRRALDIVTEALEHGSDFDIRHSDRAFNVVLSGFGEVIMLPALMGLLESQGSQIRINTRSALNIDIEKEMHFGNIDLFLWVLPSQSSDMSCLQIGTMKEVCLVRKGHPNAGKSISLQDYAGLRHIVFRMPGDYGPTINDRELWRHGLHREHAMTVHSFFDAPRVINATDLICSVPNMLGRHLAKTHQLKLVESPLPTEFPVYLIWPKSMDSDPGHQWLRNTVREMFEQEDTAS